MPSKILRVEKRGDPYISREDGGKKQAKGTSSLQKVHIVFVLVVGLNCQGIYTRNKFLFRGSFITCFRLDTPTYDCIGTSGKNYQNPNEGVLVKNPAEIMLSLSSNTMLKSPNIITGSVGCTICMSNMISLR